MKNDNKCFLYVVKMALHYEGIKKTPIENIKN